VKSGVVFVWIEVGAQMKERIHGELPVHLRPYEHFIARY